MHKQLTVKGIIIGVVGCVIITTASVYTALKLGMLPWPILFAAIVSLFILRVFKSRNLNEVNVTHTTMSAGAMVAGGMAFTIPAIWMLGYGSEVNWWQMLIIALSGVILGLICTVFLRKHFIEDIALEFPLGQAAAQSIIVGDSQGRVGFKLFGSIGFAGVFALLRDWLGLIPAMLFGNAAIPGVATFGIFVSPMVVAVGFMVGTAAILTWFIGALLGHFGIIFGAVAFNLADASTAQGVAMSIGMGLMIGAGVGVIAKVLASAIAKAARAKKGFNAHANADGDVTHGQKERRNLRQKYSPRQKKYLGAVVVFFIAAIALIICFALDLGPLVSLAIVALVWITCAMGAQSVGQTGIDPMEVFGLIVLLIVSLFSDISQVQLLFVAAIIAVACGLTGDVMNDFKAGHIIGTRPSAQIIGQAIGGIIGAVVAVVVLVVLVQAYGVDAFGGPDKTFIATQAFTLMSVMTAIPAPAVFAIALLLGLGLYLVKLPSMMLGLGFYLPFYLSLTAFLGLIIKLVYDYICKMRIRDLDIESKNRIAQIQNESAVIIPAGLLGGESIAGVLIALMTIITAVTA